MKRCCVNNKQCVIKGQWWHVHNYYGLTGTFCPHHYKQISHDANGNPENKIAYERIFKKQIKERKS